jgi:pimeloyl-ACP methyl ester carboxylesterase
VLIHGAWQGSWSWDAWLPYLRQRGWQAHAVDLPGNGCDPRDHTPPEQVTLERYTAHVLDLLRRLDGPAVVLGHSGGGITASQVAEAAPERVACLVYLAGMMLPDGCSYAGLLARSRQLQPTLDPAGIGPHLQWSDDGAVSSVPPQAARDIFLHDATADAALRAIARLRPQPEGGRAMAPRLSMARYGSVPRVYVEALQDRSVLLPLQRLMQSLAPGALRLSLDCGHVPQLVRPRELSDLLLPVLETYL